MTDTGIKFLFGKCLVKYDGDIFHCSCPDTTYVLNQSGCKFTPTRAGTKLTSLQKPSRYEGTIMYSNSDSTDIIYFPESKGINNVKDMREAVVLQHDDVTSTVISERLGTYWRHEICSPDGCVVLSKMFLSVAKCVNVQDCIQHRDNQ